MRDLIGDYFSAAEQDRIRQAVETAEGQTAGEIVPYAVVASDDYSETAWKGATLAALAAALAAAGLHGLGGFWGIGGYLWLGLPTAAGAAVGFLAASRIPWLKRLLVAAEVFERRVERRAALAFIEEEVFFTRERTGILIFVSVFERQVLILGDSGINAKVEPQEWGRIVAEIAAGIAAGKPTDALVEGIGKCGDLLERRGVEIRPDDIDELTDQLRTRNR
jgi:putative membrane protein